MLHSCTAEQFKSFITNDPADKFAKTFVAKANMQKQWEHCVGFWKGEELLGAIITTISKRNPKVANLQLLHTFNAHRGKGVGRVLTEHSLEHAIKNQAIYFRVSAEPDAVVFYEKCGFTFWGKQKSGSSLSIFKIKGNTFSEGLYYDKDPVIRKALYSGRKGSLASSYEKPEQNQLDT